MTPCRVMDELLSSGPWTQFAVVSAAAFAGSAALRLLSVALTPGGLLLIRPKKWNSLRADQVEPQPTGGGASRRSSGRSLTDTPPHDLSFVLVGMAARGECARNRDQRARSKPKPSSREYHHALSLDHNLGRVVLCLFLAPAHSVADCSIAAHASPSVAVAVSSSQQWGWHGLIVAICVEVPVGSLAGLAIADFGAAWSVAVVAAYRRRLPRRTQDGYAPRRDAASAGSRVVIVWRSSDDLAQTRHAHPW